MATEFSLSKDKMIELYRQMIRIRRFEERVSVLYTKGEIGGFCHLCLGQEAVVAGVLAVLKKEDAVITTYRDHGQMIAMNMSPLRVMAELVGRRNGYSKGKGGSMHMFSLKKNFYGGHGVVGANVPLGTGIALAQRYKNTNHITACFYGDGAANQGQVYEAMNMAALWKLPILYIIENNLYGMGTALKRSTAYTELSQKGVHFGVKGKKIDGLDVLAVTRETQKAAASVRSKKGPLVLEMMTYRYKGHSMSDPGQYRSKEEVQQVKDHKDCLTRLQKILLKNGVDEETLQQIDNAARKQMMTVAKDALKAPLPPPEDLYTDVTL